MHAIVNDLGKVADKFGVTLANVGYIVRRKTWKHVV